MQCSLSPILFRILHRARLPAQEREQLIQRAKADPFAGRRVLQRRPPHVSPFFLRSPHAQQVGQVVRALLGLRSSHLHLSRTPMIARDYQETIRKRIISVFWGGRRPRDGGLSRFPQVIEKIPGNDQKGLKIRPDPGIICTGIPRSANCAPPPTSSSHSEDDTAYDVTHCCTM